MNAYTHGGSSRLLGLATWSIRQFRFSSVDMLNDLSTPFLSLCYLFASLVCLGLAQPLMALYFFFLWTLTSPKPLLLRSFCQGVLGGRSSRIQLCSKIAGLATLFVLASASFSPAQAQFLQSAEQAATDLTTGLGGATDISPVITFIFGALRLLLIVYMAVALIQIVNSARQGEEWKDLVRTPLLIILVVIIGDFIAAIVVGGGGAAV